MDAFKSDIANSSISKKRKVSDANDLAELYNSELRHVLDEHAGEVHRLQLNREMQSAKNDGVNVRTVLRV